MSSFTVNADLERDKNKKRTCGQHVALTQKVRKNGQGESTLEVLNVVAANRGMYSISGGEAHFPK